MPTTQRIHRFKVGSFDCVIVQDDGWTVTQPRTFVNASADDVLAAAQAYTDATGDPANVTSINSLFVDTGEHRVLVDTGNGPEDGKLLDLLPAAGIALDSIDTVIITHAHGDHIQATADDDGNPRFPNARYVITDAEWEPWTREPSDVIRARLLAIADRFEQVSTEGEIVPGITTIPAPGHTPGQIALLIESEGERLLHVADVFHYQVQVAHPEWYLSFDSDPATGASSRRRLLDLAAREGLLVSTYHVGFPGMGRVRADGESWRWEPVT